MENSFADLSGEPWWKRCGCDTCDFLISSALKGGQSSIAFNLKALDHIGTCKKTPWKLKSKNKVGNGAPSGAFAFTLTKSTKDAFSVGDMLTAVRKVMSQKSCPVAKYAWYYEEKGRDENGDPIHPHIHGMYETHSGGRIEAKHFMRAWPIWNEKKPLGAGFQGGYHRPVKHDEAYANYIKKDEGMSESFGLEGTE